MGLFNNIEVNIFENSNMLMFSLLLLLFILSLLISEYLGELLKKSSYLTFTYKQNLLSIIAFVFALIIFFYIIGFYSNIIIYLLKILISFGVFHFIFNKFKYSDNTIISLLQKFVLYTICFYLSLYFLICIDIFDDIYCESDDDDEKEDKEESTNILNNNTTFNNPSDKVIQDMSDKVTDTQELADTLNQLTENATLSDQSVQQQLIDGLKKIQAYSNELQDFVDQINKDIISEGLNKNFIDNFNLDFFTTYLDSLPLLQEAALLHILLFIIILLTLSNIFGSLFANELLNYFDLENKFPSITGFLKLRAKFQKYYLSWNIFFLLILIIAAIFLNIFIFIVC